MYSVWERKPRPPPKIYFLLWKFLSNYDRIMSKSYQDGRRLALNRGTAPSDYIETRKEIR